MPKARHMRGRSAAAGGFAFCLLVIPFMGLRGVGAQSSGNSPASQAGTPAEPPAEQVFKNIQALKGMPASQMKMVMNLISASMGMRCDQCHVPDAFEKDDKRAKQTTRRMIQMTFDVNKSSFEGQPQITCYSCHRGQAQPVSAPPIGQPAAQAPPSGLRPSTEGLPTFDQVVEKYLQAVGSADAFGKLKTRVMKGSVSDARGATMAVEVCLAAPDKVVTTTTLPNGSAAQGYNGIIGWAKNPAAEIEIKGTELMQLKRSADIARPLKIREECLSPRVMGKAALGDREAIQVSGRADGLRVQYWFDAQTGLLLRQRVTHTTVLGAYPEQTDYEDYRDVDGVKLPFVIRHSIPDPSGTSTISFKEISHNLAVDDSKFNPPVQK
jgi:photosynthetic reaction center cytochrome c subunit